MTDINLSANESLRTLAVHGNQLTTLDVSNNGNLSYLFCGSNQLTSLDVSHNENLIYLNCLFNQIQTLDISENLQLQSLYCGEQAGILSLVMNGEQQSLWESNWSNNSENTNVVVASSSYTTAIKVNLLTQGNPTPAPLEGVTVTVYDSAENGNVIGTWTTNAEGIALVEHTQSTIYYTISKAGYSDTVLESVSDPNGVIAGWRVVGVDEDGNFEYLDYNGDMIWNLDDVVTNIRYSYTITDGEPYPCCMFSIE